MLKTNTKMKCLLLLLPVIVLAESTSVKLASIRDDLQNEVEELIAPIMSEFVALKKLIVEAEQHQKVQQISSLVFVQRMSKVHPNCLPKNMPFIEEWESDACFNMSTTLSVAADLSENVTYFAYNAATNLAGIINDFLNCGSFNPVTTVRCMVNEFSAFKDALNGYKPVCEKFKQDIIKVFTELREEFDECLGIHKKTKLTVQKIISETEICTKVKPMITPKH